MAWQSRKSMRSNYGRGNSGNQQQQSTRKDTTSEAVTNRDFVVICADRSGRVATFAENTTYVESSSRYSNDTKLNMFEQLQDVLLSIPTNDECMLEKQVAIYVPSAITGNLGDMYRSEKYESCRDIMLEVDEMIHDRSLNCFIVDIRGSQATIVQNAYDFVKEESKRANAQADGVEYKAPSKSGKASDPVTDKIAQIKVELADAFISGDENKVARLQSALAVLQSGKVESEPAAQPQVEDEFADTDL